MAESTALGAAYLAGRAVGVWNEPEDLPMLRGVKHTYEPATDVDSLLRLADLKLRAEPLISNGSAALWDVGDGVAALEFTGKMNALDEQVMKLIQQAIPLVQKDFKALVVYNEGSNFSAGANLGLAMFAVNIAA